MSAAVVKLRSSKILFRCVIWIVSDCAVSDDHVATRTSFKWRRAKNESHRFLKNITPSAKQTSLKGAFTRVPQVDQRGWINEIEFNGWTILFTRFHKSERGSRFQNGGKWTCAGRCCCNMWLIKECQTHFRKKKKEIREKTTLVG